MLQCYGASSQQYRAPGRTKDKGRQTLKVSVQTKKQTNKRDRTTKIEEPTMRQSVIQETFIVGD